MLGKLVDVINRDYIIEDSIDFKYTLYSLHSDGVKLFFNVLCQLINEYNKTLDRREYSRLCNFLKHRLPPNSFNFAMRDRHLFSNQEIDYLQSIFNYYTKLKSNITNNYYDRKNSIEIACNLCATLLTKDIPISDILEKARTSLAPFIVHSVSMNGYENHGEIFFHHNRLSIYIIKNWEAFESKKDDYNKILILNVGYEQFPLDLQKVSYVKNILYPSNNGQINNLRVLDICSTIQRLLGDINRKLSSNSALISDVDPTNEIIKSIQNKLFEMQETFEIKYQIKSKDFITALENIKKLFKELMIFFKRITVFKPCHNIANQALSQINNAIQISRIASSLHSQVTYALSEIKRNNTLYIVSSGKKTEEKFYGEENLSAILASNLRCMNLNTGCTINCEALVGNGRSDIHISKGENTIGIIESKLIRKNQDIKESILGGLAQLFDRYSENDSLNIEEGIQLHLVVFTLDKDFAMLDKKIDEAIDLYTKEFKLKRDDLNKYENQIAFTLERSVSSPCFKPKRRTITIHLCNLELDYKIRLKRAKYAR